MAAEKARPEVFDLGSRISTFFPSSAVESLLLSYSPRPEATIHPQHLGFDPYSSSPLYTHLPILDLYFFPGFSEHDLG
jgi:hypothetical protein